MLKSTILTYKNSSRISAHDKQYKHMKWDKIYDKDVASPGWHLKYKNNR